MTIALIEDDEAVLDSLKLLLESRGMNVRTFASAEAYLAAGKGDAFACIVSDVRLPGLSGLDLQRYLGQAGCKAPLILITGHGDIPMAVAAIKSGAFDFLEKPYDAEHLMRQIEKASAAGQQIQLEESQKAELLAKMAELSPRQKEVMELVTEGLSNKQIAARLGISPRTVENYRAWVMERLGATSLADLVRKALAARGADNN